jgi:DNA-binding CsgD family transcriptional regulator
MATVRELGRARSDVEVMSRAGLPLHQFMDEATASVQRVVPFVGACLATLDPETALVSGTRKLGDLEGRNARDIDWAQIEYEIDDPTSLATMAKSGTTVAGMQHALRGEVERSVRMASLIMPHFGYRDEARVVFTDRSGPWGAIAVFRGTDDPAFSRAELDFLADLAPSFTRGIRTGLLAHAGRRTAPEEPGPAVLIVDANDRLMQTSPGATAQLEEIADVPNTGDPLTLVHALIAGARRFARGDVDRAPRVRVRTTSGVWLVLHAAPLGGTGERAGEIVVTIEHARPPEVIGLTADVFGLTARERDVTALVLRGADTREIAATLHVSPYTVQDHLKSIFEKADVTSRGELVARIYFDQYAPRLGDELGPTGWFAQ